MSFKAAVEADIRLSECLYGFLEIIVLKMIYGLSKLEVNKVVQLYNKVEQLYNKVVRICTIKLYSCTIKLNSCTTKFKRVY